MMEIRKAKYKDAETLNHFLTLLIRDEKQYDNGIDENFVVTNMYENYIEDETKLLIVAVENDKILGYLYGKIEDADSTYKYIVATLDALYVLENYRSQGIAKTLISNFKKWAMLKNANRLKVNVWSKNKNAKKLYEQLGFKTASETLTVELR